MLHMKVLKWSLDALNLILAVAFLMFAGGLEPAARELFAIAPLAPLFGIIASAYIFDTL
jgi:hypothetical protein